MTTTTHTVAAMLIATVAQLDSMNRAAKKETGAPLFSLATDIGNGVTFRELKAWAKEQAAKQKEATPPKTTGTKTTGTKPAETKPATETGRVYPERIIDVTGSSNLGHVVYDRNTKTLTVTFKKTGAVYQYANVSLKEVRAMEAAESRGIYFNAHIKAVKETTQLETGNGGAVPKTNAKAPAEKATVETAVVNTTDLREKGFYANRKHDSVHKIVRNKDTNEREVIGTSGNRYPLASVQLDAKGKFRVMEAAPAPAKAETKPSVKAAPKSETKPAAKAPAEPDVEFTRKELLGKEMVVGRKAEVIEKTVMRDGVRHIITTSGAAFAVNTLRLNNRGRFTLIEAESKPVAKAAPKLVETKPAQVKHTGHKATRADVLDKEVRVVKGSKDNVYYIKRIVRRNDVPCAITKNGGALPLEQIAVLDGVPTFTGKISMDEYRAL